MAGGEGKVAKNYARALFEQAAPQSYDQLREALFAIAAAWDENSDLRAVILNPASSQSDKLEVMKALSQKLLPGNQEFDNFLALLITNRRVLVIGRVAELFASMVDEFKKSLSLEIISAFELSEDERAGALSQIQKEFGQEASISWSVDKNILGGLLIKAGDRLLDGSLRGSLEKLRQSLAA